MKLSKYILGSEATQVRRERLIFGDEVTMGQLIGIPIVLCCGVMAVFSSSYISKISFLVLATLISMAVVRFNI